MRFEPLPIPGAFEVDPEPIEDERGFFARTWCVEEAARHGITRAFDQCSVSHNAVRGTLRGLHFQMAPYEEAKLVRCTAGAAYDVIVDLRPGSPMRGHWTAVELTAQNRRMVYIPEGCAHGFQALTDDTEIFYQIAGTYHAEAACGIRWDDPELGIEWPIADPIVSPRDRSWPTLAPQRRRKGAVRRREIAAA